MTALFTVWRDGTPTSCGRSCYNAKHQVCRCPICGGLNHGKGPEVASAITRRHLDEWIAAAGEGAEVELDPSVQQDPLFTIGDHPMPDASPTRDEARAALTAAAFTVNDPESPNFRHTLIHCMIGRFGADWDLTAALGLVSDAADLAWTDHFLNHDLVVTSRDGSVHHFAVPAPNEDGPDQFPGRIRTTQRGFGVYAELTDCYGAKVSVHQSSSAERIAVWITADGGGVTGNKGSLHLEVDQARQVRDGLNAWLAEVEADAP